MKHGVGGAETPDVFFLQDFRECYPKEESQARKAKA